MPHDGPLLEQSLKGNPVRFLGDVDAGAHAHGPSRQLTVLRPPARAVVALHSDDPQSLIQRSRRVGDAGDLRPEPSWAASMTIIPAPPVSGTACVATPR